MFIRSINPTTEEMLAEFEEFSPEQVDAVLSEAQHAFEQWHRTSFEKRAALSPFCDSTRSAWQG